MADRWFYAHADAIKHGPFSAQELQWLALSGDVLQTDTVFKNDIVAGVNALKVKHLFPDAPTPDDLPVVSVLVAPEPPPPAVVEAAVVPAPPARTPHRAETQAAKTKRATAVQGCVIVGQDGRVVRFKKKCSKCRHEDSSWATLAIQPGSMKSMFFCPKCRKNTEVLLRGSSS